METRGFLAKGLVVLMVLAVGSVVGGCGDKETNPVATTGACCVGTTCMVMAASSCAQNGGSYKGDNVSCAVNPCGGSGTAGTISGTAALPGGTPGDITNTLVSIYADYADWNAYRPLTSVTATTISTAQISFTFTNVTPGTYYLDCWKDNDISGTWTFGDFLGVYGSTVWPGMTPSPFQVVAGQTKSVSVIVIGI